MGNPIEVGEQVTLTLRESDGAGRGEITICALVSSINEELGTADLEILVGENLTILTGISLSSFKAQVDPKAENAGAIEAEGLTGSAESLEVS